MSRKSKLAKSAAAPSNVSSKSPGQRSEALDVDDRIELMGDGHNDELLDVKGACRFLGGNKPINPATLYRGVRLGRYSKPINIGPNMVRWRRRELAADVAAMIAERDRAAPSNTTATYARRSTGNAGGTQDARAA